MNAEQLLRNAETHADTAAKLLSSVYATPQDGHRRALADSHTALAVAYAAIAAARNDQN